MPGSGPANSGDDFGPEGDTYLGSTPDVPANVEAEAALLSALMLENRAVDLVSPIVRSLDFYDPWHARIYAKMVDLVQDGRPANPVTLMPFFKDDFIKWAPDSQGRTPPDMRCSAYIAMLTGGYHMGGSGAALIAVVDLAEQVRDLSRLRQLHEVYKGAAQDALDTSEHVDPLLLISKTEEAIAPLTESLSISKPWTVGDAWNDYLHELEADMNSAAGNGERTGLRISQYDDWNDVVGEAEDGDLIYLGGRPSMGKSALAFAVAAGSAAAGHPTEIVGIEMNRRQTTRRIIANQIYDQGGGMPTYSQMTSGHVTSDHFTKIARAATRVEDWDLNIYCPDEMNVEDLGPYLRRRQRTLAAKGKRLRLVVLDYLGRLGTLKEFRSPNDRVTYISRMLKGVAKKLGIVLVVLVQLSREVERRDDKRPILADLRDSGSLEQDADVVVFVYRDEYYLERAEPPKAEEKKWEKWRDAMDAAADRLEVYSAKKREGALTKRTGFFFTRYQALRTSTFYNSDLYRRDHQPGTFFDDNFNADLPEERG